MPGAEFVNSKFLTESGLAGREAWQGQAAGAGTRQTLLAWLPTLLGAADGHTDTAHPLSNLGISLLFGGSMESRNSLLCSLSI